MRCLRDISCAGDGAGDGAGDTGDDKGDELGNGGAGGSKSIESSLNSSNGIQSDTPSSNRSVTDRGDPRSVENMVTCVTICGL